MTDFIPSTAEPAAPPPMRHPLAAILEPLASLKLTVVLFAMAIVIVLAGTLAQVNADVWDVVDEYFRIRPAQLQGSFGEKVGAFFVRIPSKIFFPSAFFPSRPTEKFRYQLPDGWTAAAPGPMQKAAFEVKSGETPLAVSVSTARGSLLDNVNRWREQVQLPRIDESELAKSTKTIQVDGLEGTSIVLEGPEETILGAVLPYEGSTWFFKARGPKALAAAEQANFDKFVSSVGFPYWPSFWFPKGWVIGGLMLLNLLAAHMVRFRLQAKGMSLVVGLWLLVIGGLVTWLVIASGDNQVGFQNETLISYRWVWGLLKISLFALGCGCTWLGTQTTPQHRVERWLLYGAAAALMAMFGASLKWGELVVTDDSKMRILYQLVKGTLAGVVLLAACLVLFRRRAGIVLLHGGVALLMISEVLVGLNAVETRMILFEGDVENSVFDTRSTELAIVDDSNPKEDVVTVVPLTLLATKGETVSHTLLPFDIVSVQAFKNAVITALPAGEKSPATLGIGLQRQAQEIRASTGVDMESTVDRPALYVELKEKGTGKDIGVLLTSVSEGPQTVSVGGKDYQVELRFTKTYLPYSLKLLDVRKDDYIGTDTPRNYSSTVLLEDPEQKTKQELTIWMNNPLRYRGLTFYQSGYEKDLRTGREMTNLQIVSNSGWMIPYVSCMIVGVGMCFQFVLTLVRFLNRVDRSRVAAPIAEIGETRKAARRIDQTTVAERAAWNFWLPIVICAVFGLFILSKARTPRSPVGQMDLQAFGRLPLAFEGRVKPFDTLARNSLQIVSGKQEYRDAEGRKQPAIRWLLDVISLNPSAREAKVFRITNLELLKLLQLEPRSGFEYSLSEFAEHLNDFDREIKAIEQVPAESQTVYQRSLRDLARNLSQYQMLLIAFDPPYPAFPTEAEIKADPEAAQRQFRESLQAAIAESQQIARAQVPLAVPIPSEQETAEGATTGLWQPYSVAAVRSFLQRQMTSDAPPPQAELLESALRAYRQGDATAFNKAVDDYQDWLDSTSLPHVNLSKIRFEQFFNSFAPFYWSMSLCVVAFLLSAVSWLGFTEPLRRSAFWLMVLTFVVHSFALIARMYISGRPPVTNLYTTGIFIGWAVVLFGLFCEKLYPLGVGNAVASLAGFITLGISHFLSASGDTFTVLQAVLDTQFWLATHVVTINLGYAATAAAGLFGVYFTLHRLLASRPNPEVDKAVTRMTYGSLCFAILFSFIGTVLGGLWADDSWGRFWGWDPKENGALIIVLWNCLVLHAKWDGMIRDRGLAVLSTLGLIAVSWSWFGTNQLGAGLHAYGFTDAARIGLFTTWAMALVLAGAGCWPKSRSGERAAQAAA